MVKKSIAVSSRSNNLISCYTHGVGHENEGVCLLLKIADYHILLDCGLSDISPLLYADHPPLDFVFCSHAHSDHSRGLLQLHLAFPHIPIYSSAITPKLLGVESLNPAEINYCTAIAWRTPFQVKSNLTLELFPAGHLPGASAILITYYTENRHYKIFYTGDFSLSNFQLVEGLSLESLRSLSPDILIIEGTQGNTRHPHRRQQEKQLMTRIYESIENGYNVLLPVPNLGLGQEILKLLRSHHQFTGQNINIWVDKTVSQFCDIYLQLLPIFPTSVQNFAKHQPLFWDERIYPRMYRLTSENRPKFRDSPYIIVADKNDNWFKYCLPQNSSWIVLYPDHPRLAPFRNLDFLRLETYLLAEHSDSRNSIQLIHNLKPQHIIFIHGEFNDLQDLSNLEELSSRYQIHTPINGIWLDLPLGDQFIQPDWQNPTRYEGEINEEEAKVTLTLPDTITQDQRWIQFADTGLFEARWQGNELIFKGLSQRELRRKGQDAQFFFEFDCCSNCLHQKNQYCWNKLSPLYGFKVTPEGYCPVFERE